MARVIRMQGYKDWKDGLITTEEMLKGNVFREPRQIRDMWLRIIARATGNWENVPHHHLCCCNTCAPTEEDRLKKMQLHDEEHAEKSAFDESQTIGDLIKEQNPCGEGCICFECVNIDVMANEIMAELDHKHDPLCCCETCIDEMFELDPENLAPSDCE